MFDADGPLPPGDYEVSFDELRQSVLVVVQTTQREARLGTIRGGRNW
jgi:hypothetical protein